MTIDRGKCIILSYKQLAVGDKIYRKDANKAMIQIDDRNAEYTVFFNKVELLRLIDFAILTDLITEDEIV